ncbi:MAG: Y-family DNA polymerase [Candidatus Dojkabacteria bacterium]
MKDKTFALVDGNNFYVSCERVFNTSLRDIPVLVLSNNDGCVVARSNEVKSLGVTMGSPFFKVQDVIEKHRVQVFSSNYALYASMSNRVVQTLRSLASEVEVYSIDESFLDLTNLPLDTDFADFGKRVKKTVWKHTNIPVSVGIASTKTLAKAANKLAKKIPECEGVLDMKTRSAREIDDLLARLPVGDVWGVGFRHGDWLRAQGITNTLQLKNADEKWIRRKMTVMGERTVLELRGIPCYQLETIPRPKKCIASTRMFGRPVELLSELEEAVTLYITIAAEKLRKQHSAAAMVCVFIHTNRHRKSQPQYANSLWLRLPEPTCYTPDLVKTALRALRQIYKNGYQYSKAGVLLAGIVPVGSIPANLFETETEALHKQTSASLITAVDAINRKWGRNTLFLASRGTRMPWSMKQIKKSWRFTTDWRELPIAKTP